MSDGLFWIDGAPGLALVLRPRGDHWLEQELARLRRSGVDTLVSMLEEDEAGWLGLRKEGMFSERAGIAFLSFPIPDHHVPPNAAAFTDFISGIAERLESGERVAVHCQGTIGRATVTAACTLVHLGWSPNAALDAIELARGCEVPDTDEQRKWILRYRADA
jgi:protein-tyrosine phosphatase